MQVTIFDFSGRQLISKAIVNNQPSDRYTLSVASLISGIYIVEVQSDKGVSYMEKVVKGVD
jgi:hypothetical protein